MKRLFTLAVLILLNTGLFAQTKYLKDVTETQELSKKVVALFKANKIAASFQELSPYWPIPKNELDALEDKTLKYLNLVDHRFGKPIGTIKVKNEKIADIALRETYLVRYENTAIRLIFVYYKNNNGWIVNGFRWDDSFAEEFE